MASALACRSLAVVLAVVFAVCVTGVAASKSFNLTNSCLHTVWPAISADTGSVAAELDTAAAGLELAPGQWVMVSVPSNWSGHVWARTLCSSTDSGGRLSCVTGGGGAAAPPVTLPHLALNGAWGTDEYDVSLVDGFNLPVLVAPQGQAAALGGTCAPAACGVDLNVECPAELRVMSGASTVACMSACQAFGSPEFCCTGAYADASTCEPTAYSRFFKSACPRALSYPYDGATSTFTCDGRDTSTYTITFCPNTNSGYTTPATTARPIDGSTTDNSQIGLIVGVLAAVTAVLSLLAAFLGLFDKCKCCS